VIARDKIDSSSGISALAIGILGTLFCVILVVMPDLLPALIGRSGMVWTPINSQQYRIGDAYYYAAWVAEILRSGIPPSSPSAAELAGQPLLESVRWFPLLVAALPGLVIRDFRFVYIIDFALTAAVLFIIPFRLAVEQLKSPWGGFLAGVSVLFFVGQWWSHLPIAPGVNGSTNFLEWLGLIFGVVVGSAPSSFSNIYESEALQGSFRFINNSISAPLLLIYVYGCFRIYSKDRMTALSTAWVLAMSIAMAFSYPSRVLTAYFVLAGLACLSIARGKRNAAIALFSIGLCTIALLLLGGYVSYLKHVFAINELWNNIFDGQSKSLVDRPLLSMLAIAAANKYVLSLALALVLVWPNRDLRDLTLVVGVLACCLACTYLFDMPLLWPRFLDRGVDHVWFMCLMLSLVAGWKTWAEPSTARRATLLLVLPVFILIVLIPLRAFGDYAIISARNSTRFMSAERWETLQWIKTNVEPGATIAAPDWDDITFIPIYTSAKLAVDNMIIGGRSPSDELFRYVSVWKLLGFDRRILELRLQEMVPAAVRRRLLKVEDFRNPPLSPGEDFPASQIAEAVIYWPYVSKVKSIDVATSAKTTEPALVDWIMSVYDTVDAQRVINDLNIKYVLLSGNEIGFDRSVVAICNLVFENATHKLYAVKPQAPR
jgi:hypothetical protein